MRHHIPGACIRLTSLRFSSCRATLKESTRIMIKNLSGSGLVYSTETGRMCPDCRKALVACICRLQRNASSVPSIDGVVRVSLESKGRGGKTVTVVKGLPLDSMALAVMGKQLKATCGSGGTAKDGVIEVQGDHCGAVMLALQKVGYTVKRSGG